MVICRLRKRCMGARRDVYWVSEANGWETTSVIPETGVGKSFDPLQLGLIYVIPEEPNGKPDPVAAAGHP